MRRIIDSHAHMESYNDPEAIIKEANNVGVDAIICVGGDLNSSLQAIKLATSFPDFLYAAIGVHPSNVLKVDLGAAEQFISKNLKNCVALGEVGLDYAYDFARSKDVRARMRLYLEKLLEIACDFGVPASVHSRSAYRDTLDILAASGVEAAFHWYDGPIHILNRLLDEGFYISATPAIEYSKGVRSVMTNAPLDRILVETDSPVFLRNLGRQSSPADVVRVVDALAELKEVDTDEIARVTTHNTEKLFRI